MKYITRKNSIYLGIGLALVVALGLIGAYAGASPHARHGGGFHKAGMPFGPHKIYKMMHHLDLSREQKESIGTLMDEHRPIMRTYMLDMFDAKKELQSILKNANYDPAAIERLAQIQAKNTEQVFLATAKTFAAMGSILTPEQRQKVAEKLERHRRHRGHNRHGSDDRR